MKKKIINYILLITYMILFVSCFFMFIFKFDITITAANSYALLEGHFFDFYDYNINILGHETVYGIVIYILFAIWNIIPYILGVKPVGGELPLMIVYWNKFFLVVCLFVCAYVIWCISQKMEFEENKRREIVVSWCSMPLLLFLVNIQASYDILYVCFALIGYYFYLKEFDSSVLIMFNIMMGISICIKPFALLYYFVFLLLKEKRVEYIIGNIGCAMAPYIIAQALFSNSPAYQIIKKFNYNNIGSLLHNSLQTFVPFIVCYILVCGYAYWKDYEKLSIEYNDELIFICNCVSFCFIGFSMYHPQWIMMAIPFWIFAAFRNKRFVGYYCAILLLTVSFYILFSLQPEVHVDEGMFYLLTSKAIGSVKEPSFIINHFYKINDIRIAYSLVSGLILLLAVCSNPRVNRTNINEIKKSIITNRIILTIVSYIGILAYVIPAILCWYPLNFMERTLIGRDINFIKPDTTTNWVDMKGYYQNFRFDQDAYVTDISFKIYTWNKKYENEDKLFWAIYDEEGNQISDKEILLKEIVSEDVTICVDTVLYADTNYVMSFVGSSNVEEDMAALGVYMQGIPGQMNLKYNEDECPYVLAMNIQGKPLK